MGIGNDLVGDLELLLTAKVLTCRSLFRMTGVESQSWRAEKTLEAIYPGMGCLLLPSATVGLSLVLESLNLPPGGEVLISPFGWLSNWSCIHRAGLVPRFLPLDEGLQLRADQVAARINEGTVAVVVTHLMGRGQQAVGEIAGICERHGIPLLEDIAQSFGVSVGGQRAGTFGAAAWCSLNHHKVLSTGDGGFVCIRNQEVLDRVSAMHDQGCVIRNGKRRPASMLAPGLSLRVSELVAAVLRGQLARYHLVRTRIQAMNVAVGTACQRDLGHQLIPTHKGDIPFTVLFKKRSESNYPSLTASGWHVAPNVPWLEEVFAKATDADPEVAATVELLEGVGAVGSGFVDPFYAIPIGLGITDSLASVPSLIQTLEQQL